MAGQNACSRRHGLPSVGDGEHRQPGTGGVDAQQSGCTRGLLFDGDQREDRGQHRSRAWRPQQTQAHTQQQRATVAGAGPGADTLCQIGQTPERRHRALQQARPNEQHAENKQHDDAARSQRVVMQLSSSARSS